MTILKPSAYKDYIKSLIWMFCLILAGGLVYIFEYNSLVDSRFEFKTLQTTAVDKTALNADLKNIVYQAAEPRNLEALAKEERLVLERNPYYLNSEKWLSDSSR